MKKLPPRLLFLIVAALLAFAVSCTTVKRVAITSGPVAVAGGLGALAGPVAAAVAAGATAAIMMLTVDNDELRSGETMSRDQLEAEMDRWRGTALSAQAKAGTLETWLRWALAGFVAWFGWRNRAHLLAFGPGYLGRLAHAMFGTKTKRGTA